MGKTAWARVTCDAQAGPAGRKHKDQGLRAYKLGNLVSDPGIVEIVGEIAFPLGRCQTRAEFVSIKIQVFVYDPVRF